MSWFADPAPGRTRTWLLWSLLTLLALAGNLANLPITLNIEFLFGSIFTLLATALLGTGWGLACTLVSASYTYLLWNHPYAVVIFMAETAWAGRALSRGRRDLLLVDTMFWTFLGIPLVFVLYRGVQGMDLQPCATVALKQALNGVINALVAAAVLNLAPGLERLLGLPRRPRTHSIGAVVFFVSLAFLLGPTVGLILFTTRQAVADGEARLALLLTTDVNRQSDRIRLWVEARERACLSAGARGLALGMRPVPALAEELDKVREIFPDMLALRILDDRGRVLATSARSRADAEALPRPGNLRPGVTGIFRGLAGTGCRIALTAPLLRQGRCLGWATCALDPEFVRTRLDPPWHPLIRTFTLLDGAGRVITSTDASLAPMAPWSEPPAAAPVRISEQVCRVAPPPRRLASVLSVWDRAQYLARQPIPDLGWTLVGQSPVLPQFRQAWRLIITNLAALLASFLAFLWIARWISALLLRPSAELAAIARDIPARVEAGERVEWPSTGFTEISQMTGHFRRTAEALGARIRELKEETDRRLRTERALIHQSRLAAMGELLGHIAHQWRQPLNILGMVLTNQKDAWRDGRFDAAYLESSHFHAEALIQRMSATIDEFRDFLQPDPEPRPFSPGEQVQAAADLVEAGFRHHGIRLEADLDGGLQVLGRAGEFAQVVLILLDNAKDAILARGGGGGRVRVRLFREGSRCLLKVSDDGCGIPDGLRDRIFEPYVTTKGDSGFGLGLYIARLIVHQRMHGSLEAATSPEGAEFTVSAPLAC